MKIVRVLAVLFVITLLGIGGALAARHFLARDVSEDEEAAIGVDIITKTENEPDDTEVDDGDAEEAEADPEADAISEQEDDDTDSVIPVDIIAEETNEPQNEPGRTLKVVCVGDSLTRGDGVEDKKRDSYPAQLEAMLGDGYEVYNYGVDGRSLLKNSEMPYTDTGSYEDSIYEKGDIYIILLGSNDSISAAWNPDNFKSELYDFVRTYMSLPSKPKVILGIPPKGRNLPEDNQPPLDVNNGILEGYINPAIASCARDLGLVSVDLYRLTDSHTDWYSDSTHMNPHGYGQMAAAFREAVLR